jgi:hypothetical protein
MSDCGMTRDMFLVMGQRIPAYINNLDSDGNLSLFGKKIKLIWGEVGDWNQP